MNGEPVKLSRFGVVSRLKQRHKLAEAQRISFEPANQINRILRNLWDG